ncbi:MAG: GMP synthase [Haliscomenobacter sp.]|uniref:type 1 glutamine amidotransferase n=1 Tax=Haliscomenobacter sp. TaxID=2717303 RepID=UPI0029AA3125|nr:GMP synthase [Haliscomenobacter sp.]MDX2070681.1 GMP synthase [Haliscomenobacter sp.]
MKTDETIKIAVLDMYDNWANEGMRCIRQIAARFLEQDGIEGSFEVFNVRANNEIPDLEAFDIFISSGGPGSPLAANTQWEKDYFAFVDSLFAYNRSHARKKFMFLICHSFQMVCRHLGLAEVTRRQSTSFGVMPIHRMGDGYAEFLFHGLPEPFYAVDSRDYQVTQVNETRMREFGAQALCLEKERPHIPLERAVMAIRFSPEVFGTQFHPEADSRGMLRYYLMDDKRKWVIETHGEVKYFEMIDRLDDPDKIMLTEAVIIPSFLHHAAEQLQGALVA